MVTEEELRDDEEYEGMEWMINDVRMRELLFYRYYGGCSRRVWQIWVC